MLRRRFSGLCPDWLDKPARRIADLPIAYRGFEIPDKFVVGYGLDLAQRYRNLPFIAILTKEAMDRLNRA